MIDGQRARLRGVRACVFGLTALLLSLGGHLAAGGGSPGFGTLAAVALPVACASVVLARRTRGGPVLLAALATTQLVLHEVFMTGSMAMNCGATRSTSAHAGHGAMAATCGRSATMAADAAVPSLLMVLAHAIATVATALLLLHGERTLVRVWAWMRPALVAPIATRTATAGPRVAVTRTVDRLETALHDSDLSLRGPPRATAVPLSFA